MEADSYQHLMGDCESPRRSGPYLKHHIDLDRTSRTVVAVQEQRHKRWTPPTQARRKLIQRIILEIIGGVVDDPPN